MVCRSSYFITLNLELHRTQTITKVDFLIDGVIEYTARTVAKETASAAMPSSRHSFVSYAFTCVCARCVKVFANVKQRVCCCIFVCVCAVSKRVGKCQKKNAISFKADG